MPSASIFVDNSFWDIVQGTTDILPCMQNFWMNPSMRRHLWGNRSFEISVEDGFQTDRQYCYRPQELPGTLHHQLIVALTVSTFLGIAYCMDGPGVGVTKTISPVPLFSIFVSIIKTQVSCWILRLYLAGVAAAQLWWHLSNMNVIQIIWKVLLQDRKFCLRRN